MREHTKRKIDKSRICLYWPG